MHIHQDFLLLLLVLAVKQVSLTQPNKQHKKYSYKLRGLDISRANQVWSTDITYIKINGGMVYLAAVIDWHSKAVLSHKIYKHDGLRISNECIGCSSKSLW